MALIQPVQAIDYGQILRQGMGMYQDISGIQRQQKQDEIEASERFNKERTIVGAALEGKDPEFAKSYLSKRLETLTSEGRNTDNTQKLLNMYASNDPSQINKANFHMVEARKEGQALGYLPKDPKQPVIFQEAARIFPNDVQAQNKYIREARFKPQSLTTVNLGGERTEQKELGKIRARGFEKVIESGDLAQGNLNSLDILDNVDVQSGKLEPFKQSIAAWGQSMGMDTSRLANVAAGQSFTAESSKVVLNAMQAQKGPQTESDMRQIRTTVSNLGNAPEANSFINNAARATSLRAIEKRDFYNNYLAEKDTLKGVSKAWNEFGGNAPLVSKYKSPKTGLPIFFHEFERDAIARSEAGNNLQPGFTPTRKQIMTSWRNNNRGKILSNLRKNERKNFPMKRNAAPYQQQQVQPIDYGQGVR